MGDLEAQTDQDSSMPNFHHSFFESSSVSGMSRLDENTRENTISNRSDVAILRGGEMSQDGIEMVSDEEINAELAWLMKVSFDLCIKISIISRRVKSLYFAQKLPKRKL